MIINRLIIKRSSLRNFYRMSRNLLVVYSFEQQRHFLSKVVVKLQIYQDAQSRVQSLLSGEF